MIRRTSLLTALFALLTALFAELFGFVLATERAEAQHDGFHGGFGRPGRSERSRRARRRTRAPDPNDRIPRRENRRWIDVEFWLNIPENAG